MNFHLQPDIEKKEFGVSGMWDVVELLADRFISVYLVGNFGLMSYGICESCAYKAF